MNGRRRRKGVPLMSATTFEFINTTPNTPLQIIKKLQVCDSSTKVHFKNSWESNHVEGCKSLSSL